MFKRPDVDMSVIFPSRGRPEQLVSVINEWMGKQNQIEKLKAEYIIVLDQDDDKIAEYLTAFNGSSEITLIVNPPPTTVNTVMNNGAKLAGGNIIVCASDDFGCPPNWDAELKSRMDVNRKIVLMANDGIQPMGHLCTIPTCTKKFYDDWGYIYWEEYIHYCSDTDFTERAKRFADEVVLAPDLLFEHRHMDVGKAPKDATYERALQREGEHSDSRVILAKRMAANFGRSIV